MSRVLVLGVVVLGFAWVDAAAADNPPVHGTSAGMQFPCLPDPSSCISPSYSTTLNRATTLTAVTWLPLDLAQGLRPRMTAF